MTLFRSITHRDIWLERWCDTCFKPEQAELRLQGKGAGCPIRNKALASDRKPPQWDRQPRADEMHRTIRCNSYEAKPPVARRRDAAASPDEAGLFDIDEHEVHLVPVEGWPDYRAGKDGIDHA